MPKITKSFVDTTCAPGDYRDTELPGFLLRVRAAHDGSISKRYILVAKPKGSRTNVSVAIGKHGILTTQEARDKAKEHYKKLKDGINPNQERRAQRRAALEEQRHQEIEDEIQKLTLERLLDDYIDAKTIAKKLKPRTANGYRLVLKRCVPDWLNTPMVDISPSMIKARQLELTRDHPAQANLTMRVLRALFSYARHAYSGVDNKPLISENPVEILTNIGLWSKVPRRNTVVKETDLRKWYQGVMALDNDTARDVLLFEIFTGLRQQEAMTVQWKNVDFESKTFKVKETKNGKDHILPLSDFLFDLLQKRWDSRDKTDNNSSVYVFPCQHKTATNRGHISDIRDAVKKVNETSGVRFTEHDLRRTFASCAENLDISAFVLKRLLNHSTNDVTEGYTIVGTFNATRLADAMQKITDFFVERMQGD